MTFNVLTIFALLLVLATGSFAQGSVVPLSETDIEMLKASGYSDTEIAENGQQLLFELLSAEDEDEDEEEEDDGELMIPPLEADGTFSPSSIELMKAQGLTDSDIEVYFQQMQIEAQKRKAAAEVEPPRLGPDGVLSDTDREALRLRGASEQDINLYEKQLQMLKVQPVLAENDSLAQHVKEALKFQGYSREEIVKMEKQLQDAAGFKPVGSVPLDKAKTLTFDYEMNPYFTFAGFGKLFTDPVVIQAGEEGVYGYLLSHFVFPKFVTLQLSVNPFPNFGAMIKRNHDDQEGYDESWYGSIIKPVTGGFPDAGAVSLFLGNRVFSGVKETGTITGQGFGGLLINYGPLHIVNSIYVVDHWLELEAKLKGANLSALKQMAFSFRVGGKIHSHNEIENTLFISLKRDRTDKDNTDILSIKNSDQEIRFDVTTGFKPTLITFIVGKKMPIYDGKYVFSLSLGVLKSFTYGYTGALHGEVEDAPLSFVVRPNILF